MSYEYELIRSDRKSISISISSENKITVRCPYSCTRQRAEQFLQSKSCWIDKILAANSANSAVFAGVISYKEILIAGEKYSLTVGAAKNRIAGGIVELKSLKSLKKLFCDSFSGEFLQRVREISTKTNLLPRSVTLKNYTSRWGCCNGKNEIFFNYKIFMLPPALRDYIILHELCHIAVHNHSAAFWRLVQSFSPDYKKIKSALGRYDFLTRLY